MTKSLRRREEESQESQDPEDGHSEEGRSAKTESFLEKFGIIVKKKGTGEKGGSWDNRNGQTTITEQKRIDNQSVVEYDLDERVVDLDIPLWNRIHYHMAGRMLFSEDLCPPLTASIGGHIADVHQSNPDDIPGGHDCPFYFFKGRPEVMNVPINLIAPAGFSKSYVMAQYFEKGFGICPIPSTFQATLSEAGFVYIILPGGELIYGIAHTYRNGFLLFNEISNIFISGASSHSGNLVNQVMEALSERSISKSVGGHSEEYKTKVTIWGGVQPSRFTGQDMSQGTGRRFCHVNRVWLPEDIELFKDEREKEKTAEITYKINMQEVNSIRKAITDLQKNIIVEKVVWEGDMYKYLRDRTIGHIDLQMYERLLVGKELLNHGTEKKVIKIEPSEENKSLVNQVVEMARLVAEGGDISLLMSTIGDGQVSKDYIWDAFRRYSYQIPQMNELIEKCIKLNLIEKRYDHSRSRYVYCKEDTPKTSMLSKLGKDAMGIGKGESMTQKKLKLRRGMGVKGRKVA